VKKLRIELAKPADLDRFVEMQEEVLEWLAERGLTPLASGIHRESRDYYGESIEKQEVYFAFADATPVGAFRLQAEDEIVWPGATNDAFYLYSLIVLREWAGNGFGRDMLAWCENHARLAGRAYLRLDCFANNAILRRYYEKAGYSGRLEVDAEYPFGTLRLARYEKSFFEVRG
jgi:ribosomal protein S18 acetylase RimI-like enzyme